MSALCDPPFCFWKRLESKCVVTQDNAHLEMEPGSDLPNLMAHSTCSLRKMNHENPDRTGRIKVL